VIAVDLDKLGGRVDGPVADAVDPVRGWVYTDSFAGSLGLYRPQGSTSASARRLFLPTRANNRLYAIEADGAGLTCRGGSESQDCSGDGLVLAVGGRTAQDPFDLAFRGSELFVTHLRRDSDGDESFDANLARLDAESFSGLSFVGIGAAPSEGIVDTPAGLYFTGRALRLDGTDQSEALRALVDGVVVDARITESVWIKETRGLGVSTDGKRLFVATRGTRTTQNPPAEGPDGLLVIDISPDAASGLPRNKVVGFTALPEGASRVAVLAREGLRDLVAVSCTDSDAVALYDDELGVVARSIEGIDSPSGLAFATRPQGGKRLFVASFGNHTVDVVDLPDPAYPASATLVGRLGGSTAGTEVTP
jgi:DNA-binding beta-propeller fold protein YncE